MPKEYKGEGLERPENLEYKSTNGAKIGYNPAEVPHASRTSDSLTDDERNDAMVVPGTPHAGNGVTRKGKDPLAAGLDSTSGGVQTQSAPTARSSKSSSS